MLLTQEAEKSLKDLAGNAMTTTVVGAAMISGILLALPCIIKSKKNLPVKESLLRAPLQLRIHGSTAGKVKVCKPCDLNDEKLLLKEQEAHVPEIYQMVRPHGYVQNTARQCLRLDSICMTGYKQCTNV